MVIINENSHIPFLANELKRLLPADSFVSRLWRTIGQELHHRLVDWPDETETEYSRFFPVDALFAWIEKDRGLDPVWLASEDGIYLDDEGKVIPPSVKPAYSAEEQLAAYGLWLLKEKIVGHGPVPGPLPECNDYGWNYHEVIGHRAACMLFAYQALCYAHRILRGNMLTAEEAAMAQRLNFSRMGKAGARKRHQPMTDLRTWAVTKYKERKWKSASFAANELKESIIAYGRSINANISETNGQNTIADWFRKSV